MSNFEHHEQIMAILYIWTVVYSEGEFQQEDDVYHIFFNSMEKHGDCSISTLPRPPKERE